MREKILFITTNNLSTNPRLVKELRLAEQNGYQSTVILFQLGNWSDRLEDELQSGFSSVKFIRLSATRSPFLPWFFSSMLEKFYRMLPIKLLSPSMLSVAVGKRSFLLQKALKKITANYNLVIAHNPAAFYPALLASQRIGARLGIDVEDYHPGEAKSTKMAERVRLLMRTVLTNADYCSFAAPLIMEEVHKDVPVLKGQQITLLNGFERGEFLPPLQIEKEALQLVWFSQNINKNRGLEKIIPVLNELFPAIELHLIGKINEDFAREYLQNRNGIILHGSLSQKELHQFLSKCDIGLAVDTPVDRNRELALTNKILAYVQAGLFIAATHTAAQDAFLQGNNLEFVQMDNEQESIRTCLQHLFDKKEELRSRKGDRFKTGRQYDWEIISASLVKIWNS